MDIVERLRMHDDERLYEDADRLMSEAADEIKEQRIRIQELECENEILKGEIEYWKSRFEMPL